MIFDSTGFTLPVFTAMQAKLGITNKCTFFRFSLLSLQDVS